MVKNLTCLSFPEALAIASKFRAQKIDPDCTIYHYDHIMITDNYMYATDMTKAIKISFNREEGFKDNTFFIKPTKTPKLRNKTLSIKKDSLFCLGTTWEIHHNIKFPSKTKLNETINIQPSTKYLECINLSWSHIFSTTFKKNTKTKTEITQTGEQKIQSPMFFTQHDEYGIIASTPKFENTVFLVATTNKIDQGLSCYLETYYFGTLNNNSTILEFDKNTKSVSFIDKSKIKRIKLDLAIVPTGLKPKYIAIEQNIMFAKYLQDITMCFYGICHKETI